MRPDSPLSNFIIKCQPGLPICLEWDRLVEAIVENQVIIVTGETGSGKSTQLPKICLAAGRGKEKRIACTQPRRIAAVTLASRVAKELGKAGSDLVGYKVRFRDRTSASTRIKFLTDGMLLAEMQRDRMFKAYDTVIIDEAHERSLNIDFLMGAIRKILLKRHDLKVIITSATIDTEKFSKAFDNAPVFNVEGRSFPVEVIYAPPLGDDVELSSGELAVKAVEDAWSLMKDGDVLVFLPTEQEIKEAVKTLKGRGRGDMEVLPMYGRLSAKDQSRIFRHGGKRKVVVSTNVAETSITVPGIVCVIDSGLARISMYNPGSGTKALPISRISVSSARQRTGRAGRVKSGVCVRLYSEEDFNDRPLFTPPEISRSNLAEVILRLAHMKLGLVEKFPFIDPPSPQAIKDGIRTLRETGAFSSRNRLTSTGRVMARMPLDPRISRIIIEASGRGCLHEAVVVAAAMSIQDPRERPAEEEGKADAAHGMLKDKKSDFLTILKIWNTFVSEVDMGRTRAEMRRFCHKFFLSYPRMLEWHEIYRQIETVLIESRFVKKRLVPSEFPDTGYSDALRDALHISVLSGFLGNLVFNREGFDYRGARGREVYIFPGSVMFKKRPRWIVCGEMVRTSKLYARLVAEIKPEWAEELAGDLCSRSYSEPAWEKKRGEAVASERVTLFGMPLVEGRRVSLKKYDMQLAREFLITRGVAEDALKRPFPFMKANRKVISTVRDMENRTRKRDIMVSPDLLEQFYFKGIKELEEVTGRVICDEASLGKAIHEAGDDSMLRLRVRDILEAPPDRDELSLFPGHITVSGHELALEYHFAPGDKKDGVSAIVPVEILNDMDIGSFSWLVPGLLPERLEFFIKTLPGSFRKRLVPVPQTVKKLIDFYENYEASSKESLKSWLSASLFELKNIKIDPGMWADEAQVPDHLRMRFVITGRDGKILAEGRDLLDIKRKVLRNAPVEDAVAPEVRSALEKWNFENVTVENYPEVPEVIKVDKKKGKSDKAVTLFPGLKVGNNRVSLKLFHGRSDAEAETAAGVKQLLLQFSRDNLAYISKRIIPDAFGKSHYAFAGGKVRLQANCMEMLYRLAETGPSLPPEKEIMKEKAVRFRQQLVVMAENAVSNVRNCFDLYIKISGDINRLYEKRKRIHSTGNVYAAIEKELRLLVPEDFPASSHPDQLINLARYLEALSLRLARADADLNRDIAKASKTEPFEFKFKALDKIVEEKKDFFPLHEKIYLLKRLESVKMLINELKVSVFAPELKTSVPVSEKKINQELEKLETMLAI